MAGAVLALSDAIVGGAFGLAGVLLTTVGVVLVALLNRSTKAEAKEAGINADTALALIERLSQREGDCLDALEVSHQRISVLEAKLGMEESPVPAEITSARVHQDELEQEIRTHKKRKAKP